MSGFRKLEGVKKIDQYMYLNIIFGNSTYINNKYIFVVVVVVVV